MHEESQVYYNSSIMYNFLRFSLSGWNSNKVLHQLAYLISNVSFQINVQNYTHKYFPCILIE